MFVKSPLITDFDSRRVLFQKVIESLEGISKSNSWDLSWGEPFIALSQDKKVWIRVFYEESLPITVERLSAEADRLKPHLGEEGRLIFCVPEIWSQGLRQGKAFPDGFGAQVLCYFTAPSDGKVTIRDLARSARPAEMSIAGQDSGEDDFESQEKLSPDEIRELTEIGVELKRYTLRKAG